MGTPTGTESTSFSERVLQASVVEQLAGGITGWEQRYDQVAPGRFGGALIERLGEGVQVFSEASSHALVQTCCVPLGSVWFGVPVPSNRLPVSVEGQVIDENCVAVRPGGVEFQLATPNDFEFLGVVVPLDELQAKLEVEGVRQFNKVNLDERCVASLNRNALESFKYEIQCLLNLRQAISNIEIKDSHELHERTIGALIDMLVSDASLPKLKVSAQYLRRLTHRVREYLDGNPSKYVTVAELSIVVGASRRALQDAFAQAWGTNPKNYLRARGLNSCRRELLNGNSHMRTVSDVAAYNGFLHLGQFGVDYKKLFGESPSETLKKRVG